MPQDALILLRQLRGLRSAASELQLKLRDQPGVQLTDEVDEIDQQIAQLERSLETWLRARGR